MDQSVILNREIIIKESDVNISEKIIHKFLLPLTDTRSQRSIFPVILFGGRCGQV